MAKYKVIVSRHVAEHLLGHIEFISNVSTEAAHRFIEEYENVITRLEDNPYQYRRAVFARWYKCLFIVDNSVVYLDSVVDCRQDDR